MLVLIIVVTAILVLTLLFFMLGYMKVFFGQSEQVNSLESASLEAAKELARIVVEDDHFGFISLADYPPIGRATVAGDGQPMPVFSINTVLATARLDLIIAHELNNPTMIKLAEEDSEYARQATRRLNSTLVDAIKGAPARDLDGNIVDVLQKAKDTYQQNVSQNSRTGGAETGSFKLDLGWLEGGAPTVTEIPRPDSKSQVPSDKQQNGKYKAFMNIPAFGKDFYFAGVADRVSLVDAGQWRQPDDIHALSAVRAESIHVIDVGTDKKPGGSGSARVKSVACAIPSSNRDLYPPGQLAIGFPHGRIPGIVKIRDILEDPQFKVNPMPLFIPSGGDWPGSGNLNGPAALAQFGGDTTPPVSVVMSMGFYDWLRSGRAKPRVDAVLALVDTNLFTEISGAGNVPTTFQSYAFSGCINDPQDPRLVSLKNGTSSAESGYLHLTTLNDIWDQVPVNSFALESNASGANTSNGNAFNSTILSQFWDGLAQSNRTGWTAYNTATIILNDPTSDSTARNNARILKERAKWVIYTSYHLADQVLAVSSHGLRQDGPGQFSTVRFKFNKPQVNDFSIRFGAGGHDQIHFASTSPSLSQAKLGTGLMNGVPNQWFSNAFGNPDSGFFIADVYNNGITLPEPGPGMVVSTSGTNGDRGSVLGANPNPPASANNEIHLRIQNDGTVQTSYGLTPFSNVSVSDQQLFGIAFGAKTTGSSNQVTWTAVMRDQVRNWGRADGGQHAGQSSAGSPPDYINNPAFGGVAGSSSLSWNGSDFLLGGVLNPQPRANYMSGGLSVEMQFRNPLVLKCLESPAEVNNGSQNGEVISPVPSDLF